MAVELVFACRRTSENNHPYHSIRESLGESAALGVPSRLLPSKAYHQFIGATVILARQNFLPNLQLCPSHVAQSVPVPTLP